MIDITPRNQNYPTSMAATNYDRQTNSPIHHSSSFTRDRELNDAEGKYIFKMEFLTTVNYSIKLNIELKQQQ